MDDVIARLEKRYGKAGKKTPQPSAAHFKKNQPPAIRRGIALQPAPTAVLNTGELPTTVTTRRKRKRAPTMPRLSEKEDRKRRMRKRHWYEDKFGDLSKFAKRPRKRRSTPAKKKGRPKRAAAKRAMAKIRSRAKKKPICFNRKVTYWVC